MNRELTRREKILLLVLIVVVMVLMLILHSSHLHGFVLSFFLGEFRRRHFIAQKVRLGVLIQRNISAFAEIENIPHQNSAAVVDSDLRLNRTEAVAVVAVA